MGRENPHLSGHLLSHLLCSVAELPTILPRPADWGGMDRLRLAPDIIQGTMIHEGPLGRVTLDRSRSSLGHLGWM